MLPEIPKKVLVPILLVILCLLSFVGYNMIKIGDNVGYAPEQPIPFSHKIHAGTNQIPCQYCHVNVDNGRAATVPAMNVCMNCHSVVKTESPYIKKLTELYKEGKPFDWVKVHDLADHAYFNHMPHIKKGVDCAVCHGDVANMDKIEQVKTLQMGFCIDCHKKNGAMTTCSTCHN